VNKQIAKERAERLQAANSGKVSKSSQVKKA
jgi:hypothetical protein